MRFSANLGFLWTELTLPNAIEAAAAAGFDAVECHWPYETPAGDVKAALASTGLPMLGLNASPGKIAAGDFGLAALAGRVVEARATIDQAVDYAHQVGAGYVHLMAGFARGDVAHATFCENLSYACQAALAHDVTILIEPLNHHDVPGYLLTTTEQALHVLSEVNAPNLKLMFDCYHVQLMEGDVGGRLERLLPHIGHIQIASVPDRAAPDHGELCYEHIFEVINQLGYSAPLGAEYRPGKPTEETLGWLDRAKRKS